MFREEYIKANEEIKPDEEFLARLKETVSQDDKVVQIGEYVNLEEVTSLADVSSETGKQQGMRMHLTWKNVVVIAACFAFVITLSFAAGQMDILNENEGIQAGMETVFSEEEAVTSESAVDVEMERQYMLVQDMFSEREVILYEVPDFSEEKTGMQYLQELRGSSYELGKEERDELVGAVVAQKYVLTASMEEFEEPTFYVAEFDDQSFICFATDKNGYIYIMEISGIQSMAKL